MSKKLKTITSLEAWDITQHDPRTLLIDVRSSMEYLFVGHPKGALHIPWIDEPDWVVNKDFVVEIRKLALGGVKESSTDDVPIILICRSGNRSDEAGKLLVDEGIRNVFHIDDGFEGKLDENHHRSTLGGWRYNDLPWEQC
jgi:rhodanese-related sulfurtransferase